MVSVVQLTKAQIRAEVATLREAGEKICADRRLAERLLKRIGADGWPESAGDSDEDASRKRKRR